MIEQTTDAKGKMGSQVSEGDENKIDREISSGRKVNGKGKVAEVSQWNATGVARYGKDVHASNEEWVYTLKVEKSYGAIIRGTCSTLLKEYLEPLFAVTGKLGHTLQLIPYVNGVFEAGINEAENLDLSEDDEWKYIVFAKRKPKYNHIEMKVKIITSLKMEFLKDAAEWRRSREREVHSRYLKKKQYLGEDK